MSQSHQPKQSGVKKATKASAKGEPSDSKALTQTGQNPVSAATVNSIPLNDGEKALVRRDKDVKRKAYLKTLEADAQAIVDGYRDANKINDEVSVLHRKFKDLVEEMRPVFERVRDGFAHLKEGETVMGERTGPAWAEKHLGVTYNWLCRCLNPPKAGTLMLTNGTKVVAPTPEKQDHGGKKEETPLPQPKQSLPKLPLADTADWTDNEYVRTCVQFVESALKPLESDPQRCVRVANAVAKEILGEMGNEHGSAIVTVPDMESDFVQMTSGIGNRGSDKEWELAEVRQ